jgi:hypothetical protein
LFEVVGGLGERESDLMRFGGEAGMQRLSELG